MDYAVYFSHTHTHTHHAQTYMLSSPTEASMFPWALHHPGVGGSDRVGGRSEGGMREGVILTHILQGSEVNIPHWSPTKTVQTSYGNSDR